MVSFDGSCLEGIGLLAITNMEARKNGPATSAIIAGHGAGEEVRMENDMLNLHHFFN